MVHVAERVASGCQVHPWPLRPQAVGENLLATLLLALIQGYGDNKNVMSLLIDQTVTSRKRVELLLAPRLGQNPLDAIVWTSFTWHQRRSYYGCIRSSKHFLTIGARGGLRACHVCCRDIQGVRFSPDESCLLSPTSTMTCTRARGPADRGIFLHKDIHVSRDHVQLR